MYHGGDFALQARCVGFDSLALHILIFRAGTSSSVRLPSDHQLKTARAAVFFGEEVLLWVGDRRRSRFAIESFGAIATHRSLLELVRSSSAPLV